MDKCTHLTMVFLSEALHDKVYVQTSVLALIRSASQKRLKLTTFRRGIANVLVAPPCWPRSRCEYVSRHVDSFNGLSPLDYSIQSLTISEKKIHDDERSQSNWFRDFVQKWLKTILRLHDHEPYVRLAWVHFWSGHRNLAGAGFVVWLAVIQSFKKLTPIRSPWNCHELLSELRISFQKWGSVSESWNDIARSVTYQLCRALLPRALMQWCMVIREERLNSQRWSKSQRTQ